MAISFDGNSSKVVIDTSTVLENTNPYALNFKIQITDTNSVYERCLSYREGSRGFMVIQEDDKLFIIPNGTNATTWGRDVDTGSCIVLLGLSTATWYNVTVNFSGGADNIQSNATVWLDGVAVTEDGTGSLNGGSGAGYGSGTDTNTLHLGARSASGSTISVPGDCILAEVTMWENHALTIADAVSLAAGNSGSTVDAANLAIHYQGLDNTDTTETVNSKTVTFYGTVVDATHPTMAGGVADITATGGMSFGSSAGLNATGKLAGSSSLSFGSSADINATGILGGSASLSFGSSAGLNGIGSLQVSDLISFGSSADLNAVGTLSGTSVLTFSGTGALNAAGTLSATSSIAFSTSAELSTSGAYELTGTATLSFSAAASLNATGKLTGSAGLAFADSASLTGAGTLAASSVITFGSSADLSQASQDAISATVGLSFGTSATLNATGAMTAVGSLTLSTSADLTQPGIAPAYPGLEYTMGGSRLHYTMSGSPLHYTIK